VKAESRRKLRKLRAAGASRRLASREEIQRLLKTQSSRVGRNGILIVSFATHGVSSNWTQHLLTVSSRLKPRARTITDREISEIVSMGDVPRALILIDACRERLRRDQRAGTADPQSAATFRRVISGIDGQVVISAAPAGGYAYDDDKRRNGVFTAAVIDALRCGAPKDRHGFVTAETLHDYVERRVLQWIKNNRDPEATKATQIMFEGRSGKLPLASCVNRTASTETPPRE
jgi:hypothetical protein